MAYTLNLEVNEDSQEALLKTLTNTLNQISEGKTSHYEIDPVTDTHKTFFEVLKDDEPIDRQNLSFSSQAMGFGNLQAEVRTLKQENEELKEQFQILLDSLRQATSQLHEDTGQLTDEEYDELVKKHQDLEMLEQHQASQERLGMEVKGDTLDQLTRAVAMAVDRFISKILSGFKGTTYKDADKQKMYEFNVVYEEGLKQGAKLQREHGNQMSDPVSFYNDVRSKRGYSYPKP